MRLRFVALMRDFWLAASDVALNAAEWWGAHLKRLRNQKTHKG